MNHEFQFLIYQSADEDASVNAVIRDETIWLTQKSMAELFDVDVLAISNNLSNFYADGELQKDSTISKMEIVQQEGTRHVKKNRIFIIWTLLFPLVIVLTPAGQPSLKSGQQAF